MARAAAESKAELLKNKLREVAERSKARGNTLASVVSAVRRVADAKQQLSSAEAELQHVLQEAEVFLQVRPHSHVRLWSRLTGYTAPHHSFLQLNVAGMKRFFDSRARQALCRDRTHASCGGQVSAAMDACCAPGAVGHACVLE